MPAKIVYGNPNTVVYSTLKPGDWFKDIGSVCVVTEEEDDDGDLKAVEVDTGDLVYTPADHEVIKLPDPTVSFSAS